MYFWQTQTMMLSGLERCQCDLRGDWSFTESPFGTQPMRTLTARPHPAIGICLGVTSTRSVNRISLNEFRKKSGNTNLTEKSKLFYQPTTFITMERWVCGNYVARCEIDRELSRGRLFVALCSFFSWLEIHFISVPKLRNFRQWGINIQKGAA